MHKRLVQSKSKNVWQMQEAKAKLSEVIQAAGKGKYQIITKNGEPIAIILSKKEFDKITRPQTSLIDFFKAAPCPEVVLDIERAKDAPRGVDL